MVTHEQYCIHILYKCSACCINTYQAKEFSVSVYVVAVFSAAVAVLKEPSLEAASLPLEQFSSCQEAMEVSHNQQYHDNDSTSLI